MSEVSLPTMNITVLNEYVNFMGADGMAKHNLLLMGAHGIGKSKILEQIFKNNLEFVGYKFHTLYLSQMVDPGDLTGLPSDDGEQMKFLPPWWWNSEEPIIVFLDEVLRARLEVIQPCFPLLTDKEIAGKKLHPKSIIVSATNFGTDYQQTDADFAFGSRFCPFEFLPTVEEWIDYAVEAKYDSRIVNYIRENHGELDGGNVDKDDKEFFERFPDRRAWERVNDIMNRNGNGNVSNIAKISVAGELGMSSAMDFVKFANTQSGLSPEQLLLTEDFKSIEFELGMLPLQELIYMNQRCVDFIKQNEDIQEKKSKPVINLVTENLLNFLKWCDESGNSEVIGEAITTIKKQKAYIGFIFRDPTFSKYMLDFIDKVKI